MSYCCFIVVFCCLFFFLFKKKSCCVFLFVSILFFCFIVCDVRFVTLCLQFYYILVLDQSILWLFHPLILFVCGYEKSEFTPFFCLDVLFIFLFSFFWWCFVSGVLFCIAWFFLLVLMLDIRCLWEKWNYNIILESLYVV